MTAIRSTVTTASAPAAVGPYSQAVIGGAGAGALLFCSGQIPLDPASGRLVGDDIGEQTRRCLQSLQAVCEAAGADLADALRLTVYTTDLDSFAQINEVYAAFFDAEPPARATVGVAALPMGAKVEIDAIVALSEAGDRT
jgi:2-iminobutanoate/2-iminopropanoate deaminase